MDTRFAFIFTRSFLKLFPSATRKGRGHGQSTGWYSSAGWNCSKAAPRTEMQEMPEQDAPGQPPHSPEIDEPTLFFFKTLKT